MNLSPRTLLPLFLLVPLTALGQSYEWFNRIENEPYTPPVTPVHTELFQVAASEHGTYAIGRTECDEWPTCYGYLVKYRAEDGKRLWQRKFSVFSRTEAFTLHVNQLGVFVGGRSDDPLGNINGHSFVRLYSHDGDTLWTTRDDRRLHETWEFEADDDSLYICGDHYSGSAVLRRISFDGEVLWTRTLGTQTNGCAFIELADGRVYLWARPVYPYPNWESRVYVIQASDGALIGNFNVDFYQFWNGMAYHDGYLYLLDYHKLVKYNTDGDEIWRLLLARRENGLGDPSSMVVADDGLLISGSFAWPQTDDSSAPSIRSGHALIKVDYDGNVADVTEFPGHWARPESMVIHDGAVYATGGVAVFDAYTARYSNKPLVRPSLLSLAGATPAMPPRLAVLSHEYGAGPMRVGIRDAAPGSLEYRFEFSEGLKPVSFDKVADLNGNGYEEMIVVSRLPAVAEIRDSLDGSLVSTIKLGSHLEPLLATVEQRDGTPPRLAVVARNRDNDQLLLRIYNLESGILLANRISTIPASTRSTWPRCQTRPAAVRDAMRCSGAIAWPVNRTRSRSAAATATCSRTSGSAATGTRCSWR